MEQDKTPFQLNRNGKYIKRSNIRIFFQDKDTELLSGEKVEPKVFNDDNVGPVMDRIYESGTIKIFSEIALKAMKTFSIESPYVHFDTTSITVYGDYELCANEKDLDI